MKFPHDSEEEISGLRDCYSRMNCTAVQNEDIYLKSQVPCCVFHK